MRNDGRNALYGAFFRRFHDWLHMLASRRTTASLACFAVLAASLVPAAAAAAGEPALDGEGRSAAVYDMTDALLEHVYVESAMDSDNDGMQDLIRADIVRPRTPSAVKVPAIITATGYNGTPGGKPYLDNANRDVSDLAFMPGWEDNYFVPRGYAYISVDVAGTNWSEGCVDNVGPNDIESVAAVIRWLHGESDATAYRNLDRAQTVGAAWSSGKSAVTGISYDGGIANAVATSDAVPGLQTVVPIAGGSSAYNTRPHGVFVGGGTADFSEWLTEPEPAWVDDPSNPPRLREHQAEKRRECQPQFDRMRAESDPAERSYNAFWNARNYTNKVDTIAANGVSVFIATGQGDMIVRTNEFGEHWAALQEAGVESKLWLHRRAHVDPFDVDRDGWSDTLHRWYDHELLGIQNGITSEPAVRVETQPDVWEVAPTWPVPGSTPATLGLAGTSGVGSLRVGPSAAGTASFSGAQLNDAAPFALTDGAAEPQSGPDRLVYASAPLTAAARISGTPSVTVRVSPEAADTNISVALVDYGPAEVVDWSQWNGIRALDSARDWGGATPAEGTTYPDMAALTATTGSYVITRGTASIAHHESIERYTPVPRGEFVDLTWTLFPADHTVPAGHRLGLIVYNNSIQLDPGTVGSYIGTAGSTIDLANTSLTVPVVGGDTAFTGAIVPRTPTIVGTAQVGSRLTAAVGAWGPGEVALSYQWAAGGAVVSGATGRTWSLPAFALGKTITVTVTGRKTGYTSSTRTSSPTARVVAATLATSTPVINGTAKVGSMLSATPGTWGPGTVALTYRWESGGVAIAGATGATYRPTSSDVGKAITVTVTGKKAGYATQSRQSVATRSVTR